MLVAQIPLFARPLGVAQIVAANRALKNKIFKKIKISKNTASKQICDGQTWNWRNLEWDQVGEHFIQIQRILGIANLGSRRHWTLLDDPFGVASEMRIFILVFSVKLKFYVILFKF